MHHISSGTIVGTIYIQPLNSLIPKGHWDDMLINYLGRSLEIYVAIKIYITTEYNHFNSNYMNPGYFTLAAIDLKP